MARGQRTNLADLAASVGHKSPVDRSAQGPDGIQGHAIVLSDLTANPRNPREDVGDLADLESIADIQLQPALAVTSAAYLKLFPEDQISARYVVINGCRRLAAAHKYGRSDLAVVINDDEARARRSAVSQIMAGRASAACLRAQRRHPRRTARRCPAGSSAGRRGRGNGG